MTTSNNKLTEELARSLESATMLMQSLLGDIKGHSTSLAIVKAKLESLSKNVESLSHIVRDDNGNGSLVTRLALIEQSIDGVESGFNGLKSEVDVALKEIKATIKEEKDIEKKDEDSEKEFKRQQLLAKLKILAVIAPGAIALVVVIIKMLMGDAPAP